MSSGANQERYTICPVCNKPNLAGTKFCQHCWGASLNPDQQLTAEEMAAMQKRRRAYFRRRNAVRYGIPGTILAAIHIFFIFLVVNYTDLIFKPPEDIYSDSLPGEWAMFRHDAARTGSAGDSGIIPEGILKWEFSADAAVHSSPAVSEGIVYFGSQDDYVYALDAETGEEVWEYKTDSWVDSSPAVAGGVVYIGSNDSRLYALDSKTGVKIWDFDTDFPVRSSPAVADGTVYFGSDDYYAYAVDIETGEELWRYNTGSSVTASPVVYDGIVYYGAAGRYSYALNCETGQRRLEYATGSPVISSAVVKDGIVYYATTSGFIHAVDGTARTWLWERDLRPYWVQAWTMFSWLPEPPRRSGFIWSLSLKKPNTTTPVICDDVMYLGLDKYIVALDTANLEILWQFETGDDVKSSPAKAGSVIYAGSDDGYLYAVDSDTGELIWKFETGDKITSSPAVVDGVVYVTSRDGKIYAIE